MGEIRSEENGPAWLPSSFTEEELNDAFQWSHRHNWVSRGWVEDLLAREFHHGASAAPGWPGADFIGAWAELTGYVQQAQDDGGQIDPETLLGYLSELKRKALKPIREHMAALLAEAPETEPEAPDA